MLSLKVVDIRSSGDLNACYSVIEAIGPETGDVLITHLHLTALKVGTLIQADLVILAILCRNRKIRTIKTDFLKLFIHIDTRLYKFRDRLAKFLQPRNHLDYKIISCVNQQYLLVDVI